MLKKVYLFMRLPNAEQVLPQTRPEKSDRDPATSDTEVRASNPEQRHNENMAAASTSTGPNS